MKRCRQCKARIDKQKAPSVHDSGVPIQAAQVFCMADKPPTVLVQRTGAPTDPNAVSTGRLKGSRTGPPPYGRKGGGTGHTSFGPCGFGCDQIFCQ